LYATASEKQPLMSPRAWRRQTANKLRHVGGSLIALIVTSGLALGHDSWINRGDFHNPSGELCCGEGDCFVIPARQVSARADGYHIWLLQPLGGADALRAEIVPYSEAQPSPDGTYVRCKRPDGSRRCFFAPPPNT
jgi:hypothetical protein